MNEGVDELEYQEKELDYLIQVAVATVYGANMKKRIERLLADYKGKIKSAEEIRQELKEIKGSLADEVIKMRR